MNQLFFLAIMLSGNLEDKIFQYHNEESVCAAWKRSKADTLVLSQEAYRVEVGYLGFLVYTRLDCKNRP